MHALSPEKQRRGVQLLLRISEMLNADDDFDAGLRRVLAAVIATLEADCVSLVLPQEGVEPPYHVTRASRDGTGGTVIVNANLGVRRRVLQYGEQVRLAGPRAADEYRDDFDGDSGAAPRALLAVPLRLRGSVLGGLWASRKEAVPFSDECEELLEAVADRLAVWVDNDRLLSSLRERLAEREMLLQASRRVGESIDLEVVLAGLFDALQTVVHFDAAAVFLTTPDGSLTLSAQRGYSDPQAIASVPEGHGIIGRARRLQRGVLIPDVADDPDYLAARSTTRSEIAVPIISNGVAIGAVNLESDRLEVYCDRDLRLAELIAAQVASAIANARLHASRVRAAQVESELGLARVIQLSLLPSGPPADSRLDVGAVNVPSSAVGGDYYDWLLVAPDRALLVIADVSGHGLSAALLTASMRTGFRMLARQTDDPAEIVRRLHALLYESSPPNQFVAGVIATVDLGRGVLRYCNAGHVPPLLVGPDGTVRQMAGGGPPMGLLEDASYHATELQMVPAEMLAFYTDGIVEAENQAGEQLGMAAVRDHVVSCRDQPMGGIIESLRTVVRSHRGRRGGHLDDVTLMAARWTGPTRT